MPNDTGHKWMWGAASVLLVVLWGAIDLLTAPELSIFYLIPVSIAAWYVGIWMGITVSLLSAGAWLVSNLKIPATAGPLSPYWETFIRLIFFLVISLVLSRLKDAIEEEKRLARTDETTGIPNRKRFLEQAQYEFDRCRRYRRPFALAYMDVDDFKTINDTQGHLSGDRLLRQIGQTIKNSLRLSDLAARVGGDEFALLIIETGIEGTRETIEKIQGRLKVLAHACHYPVSFSFGVVVFTGVPASLNEAIGKADALMYRVKKQKKGGTRVELFGGTPEPAGRKR